MSAGHLTQPTSRPARQPQLSGWAWIETQGAICGAGVEVRYAYVPKRDATVVARMRADGAIMLSKTKPGDDDLVYPRPHNPYDLPRTPGDSSSAEAALIAAAGSP